MDCRNQIPLDVNGFGGPLPLGCGTVVGINVDYAARIMLFLFVSGGAWDTWLQKDLENKLWT